MVVRSARIPEAEAALYNAAIGELWAHVEKLPWTPYWKDLEIERLAAAMLRESFGEVDVVVRRRAWRQDPYTFAVYRVEEGRR